MWSDWTKGRSRVIIVIIIAHEALSFSIWDERNVGDRKANTALPKHPLPIWHAPECPVNIERPPPRCSYGCDSNWSGIADDGAFSKTARLPVAMCQETTMEPMSDERFRSLYHPWLELCGCCFRRQSLSLSDQFFLYSIPDYCRNTKQFDHIIIEIRSLVTYGFNTANWVLLFYRFFDTVCK